MMGGLVIYSVFFVRSVVCALFAGSAWAGTPVSWLAPVDGDWDDPSAWLGGRVPNMSGDIPTLGLSGAYVVRAQSSVSYGSLEITNPLAVLEIVGASQTPQSGISNQGFIQVGDWLGAGNSSLWFTNEAAIVGAGVIELAAHTAYEDAQLLSYVWPLTHGALHTIRGSGQLFVISMVNAGEIVATGEVGLELIGTYTQIEGGRIGARGGTLVFGQYAEVSGGVLFAEDAGVLFLDGDDAVFRDLVIDAEITHSSGSHQLLLAGDVTNNGSIVFHSQSSQQQLEVALDQDAFIGGEGSIELRVTDDQEDTRLSLQANRMATIGSGQVIRGDGTIDIGDPALLTLDGIITSIPTGLPLVINGGIVGAGELVADGADILLSHNARIEGLRMRTPKAAIRVNAGTVTLKDCTNDGAILLEENNAILRIDRTLLNNGRIVLDGRNTDGRVRVDIRTETLIDGVGTFELITDDGENAVFNANFQTTTLGAGQTILGSGWVSADAGEALLKNHGRIIATDPSMPLTLRGAHSIGGDGEYQAQGGDLLLYASIFESPRFVTNAEHAVLVRSTTITDLDNRGTMRFLGGGNNRGTLRGESVNNGQIILEPFSEMNIESESSLGGIGTILMLNRSELNVGTTYSTPTIIEAGQEIRGAGTILGSMHLDGKVIADQPDEELFLNGWITFGTGELIVESSTMRFGWWTRLAGALLRTDSKGRFVVDTLVEFMDVENTGLIEIERGGILRLEADMNNTGLIQLRGSDSDYANSFSTLEFDYQSRITGDGVIELLLTDDDLLGSVQIKSVIAKAGTIGPDQTLRGAGRLIGSIVLEGTLEPMLPKNTFQITDLLLEEGSVLKLNLAGVGDQQYGKIELLPLGRLELGGKLIVSTQGGYNPGFGRSWDLVSSASPYVSGSYQGRFDSVEFPEPRDGLHYLIQYGDDHVRAILTCQADLDGDFAANYTDVSIFIEFMIANDPRADINGDGAWNYLDITLYLTSFAGGCS